MPGTAWGQKQIKTVSTFYLEDNLEDIHTYKHTVKT